MDFGTAINTCLRKYATFEGRATRHEYWWFVLFDLIVTGIAGVLDSTLFFFFDNGALGPLVGLVLLLPLLSSAARRLHDTGKSGWWQLLYLFPVVGLVVLIFFLIQPTQMMDNEYGPVTR